MNLPLGNKSIYGGHPTTVPSRVTLMEMILPPQALPLLLLLCLIAPMTLLTAESLFVPLVEWIKSSVMSNPENAFTTPPLHFFLKLGTFLILAFLGGVQLILRLNTIYYSAWARSFPRPHSLHVDYQPDPQQSMISLLNWNLYRVLAIFIPPLAVGGVTAAVGLLEIYLFNLLSGLPTVGLPIQFIIALFVIMLLSLFTGFACLNSVWTIFTTIFGDVAAVTEPDLPAKTVFDRCNRIAFSSPLAYGLYPAYFLFVVGVLVEVIVLFLSYDIQDLIGFQVNLPVLLGLEAITFGIYLILNYLKFYTYHQALVIYYAKLPQQLKERFAPPPAAVASSS